MTDPALDKALPPDKIISFPEGLPGFPTLKRFVMSQLPEERPYAWMHALDRAQISTNNISFALVDAYAWVKELTLEVDDSILQMLGSLDPLDYAVYFILRITKSQGLTSLHANAKAPLIVNIKTRMGKQIIVSNNPSLELAEARCLQF